VVEVKTVIEVQIPRRVDESAASLAAKARTFCDENHIEFCLGRQMRGALVLVTKDELSATLLEIGLA
jgi:hypothetical protein